MYAVEPREWERPVPFSAMCTRESCLGWTGVAHPSFAALLTLLPL